MEEVNISETESRYFGDLFLCCDVEKSGKVPILKATEMFRSASLSNDVIRQITSVAGIPQTAIHMSRVQFYSCLKLIAAYQASVPLRQELISSTIALPLPKFSWTNSPTQSIEARAEQLNGRRGSTTSSNCTAANLADDKQWRRKSSRNSPNLIQLAAVAQAETTTNSDVPSTDSEVEHTDGTNGKDRSRRHGGASPEAWSTASDSPTPTNSVTERPWAKNTLWQGLFCEEQRQLLGTEEESSDRHSSDDDNEVDLETVYQITSEQREYYLTQFRAVQPDQNGLLSGTIARVFFEKSRIPVEELRHIWQLCDVTRDGALSLGEFTAAMHLVVLRRNNISLPQVLPVCLQPSQQAQRLDGTLKRGGHNISAGPAVADLLHLDDDQSETTPHEKDYIRMISAVGDQPTPLTASHAPTSLTSPVISHVVVKPLRSPLNSPPSAALAPSSEHASPTIAHEQHATKEVVANASAAATAGIDWMSHSKEWTKFTESPTSNVSSPGPKPVNFDMQRTAQAVVSDPLILHPVPVRVTPIGVELLTTMGAALATASSVITTTTATTTAEDEIIRVARKSDTAAVAFETATANAAAIVRDTEASPKQLNSFNSQQRDSLQNELRAIQRPQPKKVPSKSAGAIPPPPQREPSVGGNNDFDVIGPSGPPPLSQKKEAPPLPPPRPHKHARSSSLDLNKLKLNAPTPPEVPPRVSPQIVSQVSLDVGDSSSFADFAHFPDTINESSTHHQEASTSRCPIPTLQSSLRSSAFEVYRKPTTPKGYNSPDATSTTTTTITSSTHAAPAGLAALHAAGTAATTSGTAAAWQQNEFEARMVVINDTLRNVTFKPERNLSDIMQYVKEQNYLLLRLCNDLNEELSELQRKKEDLKVRYVVASASNSTHHSIV